MPRDNRGPANPRWKGGQTKSRKGYWYIWRPGHPRAMKSGYVKRADLVLEEKIGRPLQPGEIAHHVNEIKDDDSPENLELMTIARHSSLHNPKKPRALKAAPRRIDWPADLRERVRGSSLREVAKQLGCSHVAVYYRLRKLMED